MIIRMQQLEGMTLEEMREFVESNRKLRFEAEDREALYGLLERVLKNQRYSKLSKNQRGVVRQFLIRVSGLGRAQIARLIGQWLDGRRIRTKQPVRRRFPTHDTSEDIGLLSQVAAVHEELSDRRYGAFCGGNTPCTATTNTSTCPAFRSPICTTCGGRSGIESCG